MTESDLTRQLQQDLASQASYYREQEQIRQELFLKCQINKQLLDKLPNMSDRELLEAIYKMLLR